MAPTAVMRPDAHFKRSDQNTGEASRAHALHATARCSSTHGLLDSARRAQPIEPSRLRLEQWRTTSSTSGQATHELMRQIMKWQIKRLIDAQPMTSSTTSTGCAGLWEYRHRCQASGQSLDRYHHRFTGALKPANSCTKAKPVALRHARGDRAVEQFGSRSLGASRLA